MRENIDFYSHSNTHLLWAQNANCTESGARRLPVDSPSEILNQVEQCQGVKGDSSTTNATVQLGNYQIEILSGELGEQENGSKSEQLCAYCLNNL